VDVAVDVDDAAAVDEAAEVAGIDATASLDDAAPELHAVSATSTTTTMHPRGDLMTGP